MKDAVPTQVSYEKWESVTRHGTAWHGMAWHGKAWHVGKNVLVGKKLKWGNY